MHDEGNSLARASRRDCRCSAVSGGHGTPVGPVPLACCASLTRGDAWAGVEPPFGSVPPGAGATPVGRAELSSGAPEAARGGSVGSEPIGASLSRSLAGTFSAIVPYNGRRWNALAGQNAPSGCADTAA